MRARSSRARCLGIDALAGVGEGARGAGARAVRQIAPLAQRPCPRIERADDRALDVGDEGRARGGDNVHLVEHVVRAQAVGVPAQDLPARAVVFQDLAVARIGDEHRGRAVHAAMAYDGSARHSSRR